MPATIVMGGQWGDEGKGKLTDALAGHAHLVVRANGGSNAGHTIKTDAGTFKLHLVPSGVLNPDCDCVIGAGVVIEPQTLLKEIDGLRARGVAVDNLHISERAHIVLPYHPKLDQLDEAARGSGGIGTTLRGNGPAYADKVSRRGIRAGDLLDKSGLRDKIRTEVAVKNQILTKVYGEAPLDPEEIWRTLAEAGEQLAQNIEAAEVRVQDALEDGKRVVIECAQGAMLDIDYGSYPYVTSSSPTAAGACQGAGVAPTQVDRVVAVYKAYSTRVGGGPMPAELVDDTGNLIRERGREYGTTTGRPRRTGWFDAVAARSVARLNGVTEVALTLLDVLDVFEQINVCTSYQLGSERLAHVPARNDVLARAAAIYEQMPGWRQDISDARGRRDLPERALEYVAFLAERIGAPITMVGVGPGREQLVPLTEAAAISAAA
jgi:adenylosuccinate synthase